MSKKRKTSGPLSGSELRLAYQSLTYLQNTIVVEEIESAVDDGKPFAEVVAGLVEMMRARLNCPQDLSFSDITDDHLTKFNILMAGVLKLKSDSVLTEQVERTKNIGKDDIWSSLNLYRHLQRLQTLVPKSNEAAARTWIDAFFFRVSAMVPDNEKLVLSKEQRIPPTAVNPLSSTTLHGVIDYTAATVRRTVANVFSSVPLKALKSSSGLIVAEAKSYSTSLPDHLPQAICEMYACAKALEKSIVRGALTSGDTWMFLVLAMNPDGDGAKYWTSMEISILTRTPPSGIKITAPWPDVIAGILSDWLNHGFEDIESGDGWFEVELLTQ